MNKRQESFEAAFPQLFDQAHRLSLRILGDASSAEDIAAEAMARAWLRWRHLETHLYRDAWVLRVTSNLAFDALRRKRPTANESDPHDRTDSIVLNLALSEALSKLPRRQREAVVLRHLAGWSERDVAESMGTSAGTVSTHTHRGLAALRRSLGDDFTEVRLVES